MNRVNKKTIAALIVLLFFVSIAVATVPVDAKKSRVEVPKDYPTIQAAVDAAVEGGTVVVKKGTYSETVHVYGPRIIKAEGKVLVNPIPTGDACGFYVVSDRVEIDGFEIANTNFGICFEGSNNKFSHNYIHDVTNVGISVWDVNGGSNRNEIDHNEIANVGRTGIMLDVVHPGGSGVNVGNNIHHNKITNAPDGGIEVNNAQSTKISNNKIEECGTWGVALINALAGTSTKNNEINNNEISGISGSWSVGILVYARVGSAEQNEIHHNKVSKKFGGSMIGIEIDANNNTIHHNEVDKKTVPTPYSDLGTGNNAYKNSWQ